MSESIKEFNVGSKLKPQIVRAVPLFVAMGHTDTKSNTGYIIKYSDYWVTEQGGIVSTKRTSAKELSPTRRCSAYVEYKLSSNVHGNYTVLINSMIMDRVRNALSKNAARSSNKTPPKTSTKASVIAAASQNKGNLPVSAALASRKGYIIGTISPSGKFGISADPAIHDSVDLAKKEAVRLTNEVSDKFEKGTVFIVLSIVGGFLKQDVVEL